MEGIIPIVVIAILATAALTAGMPYLLKPFTRWPIVSASQNGGKTKTLIWGAGGLGTEVMIHILTDPQEREKRLVLGFLDDDETKLAKDVKVQFPFASGILKGSVPVIATSVPLAEVLNDFKFGEIILAIEKPDATKLTKVQDFCREKSIKFVDVRGKCKCSVPS